MLLCGRYEGVDERLIARAVDEEISIGDYVLSGGELAAMVLIDAVVRQLPGVLGDAASAAQESFVDGLLDCPHYTRPEEYDGRAVPRGAALGQPRGDRPLAAETGAGHGPGCGGRNCSERVGTECLSSEALLEEYQRESPPAARAQSDVQEWQV